MPTCRECIHCFADHRSTDYRRPACYFCRRKGCYFSRNYRPGQQTRIHPNQPACDQFAPRPEGEEGRR